jgi:hypothetical protein
MGLGQRPKGVGFADIVSQSEQSLLQILFLGYLLTPALTVGNLLAYQNTC